MRPFDRKTSWPRRTSSPEKSSLCVGDTTRLGMGGSSVYVKYAKMPMIVKPKIITTIAACHQPGGTSSFRFTLAMDAISYELGSKFYGIQRSRETVSGESGGSRKFRARRRAIAALAHVAIHAQMPALAAP